MLFLLFESFVRIRHQHQIAKIAEEGVSLKGTSHIDKAVLKTSPVFAYHDKRCVFQGVEYAASCGGEICGDSGKKNASLHLAAHLDSFLHGAETNHIPGIDDVKLRGGDMFVLPDYLQGLFLVYRKNSSGKGGFLSEANLLYVEIADFQPHLSITPLSWKKSGPPPHFSVSPGEKRRGVENLYRRISLCCSRMERTASANASGSRTISIIPRCSSQTSGAISSRIS